MKKLAPLPFFLLFLLSCITAWSQDCSQYLFLQQNKTIEITIYNKKGEPSGKQVYTVSSVSNSGGVTTATVNSQLFDKKGRATTGATSTIKCTGGVFQVDMKLMLPQGPASRMSSAQVCGHTLSIPAMDEVSSWSAESSSSSGVTDGELIGAAP